MQEQEVFVRKTRPCPSQEQFMAPCPQTLLDFENHAVTVKHTEMHVDIKFFVLRLISNIRVS